MTTSEGDGARPATYPVTFKDLCVDAVDPVLLGTFWARVLGRDLSRRDDGIVMLTGATPRHTVWLAPVPEPVTVKQRVHLDVHAGAVADVLALGATPEDLDSFRWRVLRDPEGGELCVFERTEVPDERLYEIGVDSADPVGQARWWAGVLGGRVEVSEDDDWAAVEDIPGAPFECLVFAPVPEPKTVKNRIHWDVDGTTADAVEELVRRGARVLRRPDDDPDGNVVWTVMADPEGNEFCVFAP